MKSLKNCYLFFSIFQLIHCSGFLELHILSPHEQSASVNISSSDKNETSETVKVLLHPAKILNVTRVPVNFDRIYNITIKCGASNEEGLTETTTVLSVKPLVGILSPAAVARPLNGIRIVIGCDKNWYGEKCDVFCDEKKIAKLGRQCNFLGMPSCSNGLTGSKCDKKLEQKDCSCGKNGKCIDSYPKPICECSRSFRGPNCEKKQLSASLSSHYKGDFWNFRMTFWQLIFSNLVENQLAEVKESEAWKRSTRFWATVLKHPLLTVLMIQPLSHSLVPLMSILLNERKRDS